MKIKEIKIVNQDESTEVADIGANAENVDYGTTNVKLKLDELSNNVNTNTTNISNEMVTRANAVTNLQSQINGLASGNPLVTSSTSGMTDTSKVYVNTTDGKWYYYDGTNWTAGGTYQSTGIAENSISAIEVDNYLKNYFFEKIKKEDLINGKFVRADNGLVLDNASCYATNFINVIPNINITIYLKTINTHQSAYGIAFYDINHHYISGDEYNANSNVYNVTTPENCNYIRFTTFSYDDSYVLSNTKNELLNLLKQINDKECNMLNDTYYIPSDFGTEQVGFITSNGTINTTFNYLCRTQPILFKKGQYINILVRSIQNNISVISKTDENETYYNPLIIADYTGRKEYTYYVEKECYLIFSYDNRDETIITISSNPSYKTLYNDYHKLDSFNNLLYDDNLNNIFDTNNGYVTSNGSISTAFNYYRYTNPVLVEKGNLIILNVKAVTNNIAVISETDESGTFHKPLLLATSNDNIDYYYYVNKSMYICLSYDNRVKNNFQLYSSDSIKSLLYKTSLIEDVKFPTPVNILNNNLMSLFYKFGIIGDSLSCGGYDSGGNIDCSWGNNISRMNGCKVLNFARGGYSCKDWINSEFYNTIANDIAPIYYIALGTNDTNASFTDYSLGTVDDIGTNNESFYAYYYKIIQRIKEINPSAKIIVCSLYSNTVNYNNAIKYFADNYTNIYYLDISNLLEKYKDYRNNGFHFTSLGYKLVADEICVRTTQLIKNNETDFQYI